MEVTGIKIYPFDTGKTGTRVRAYAEVEFDGGLTIRGIRIIENKKGGLFIGYPSYRSRSGEYRDYILVHDRDLENQIRSDIIDKYRACDHIPGETREVKSDEPRD